MQLTSPLPALPEGARLQTALLTSYRPVSPSFFLAEVLPALLRLDRDEDADPASQNMYVAEVINALTRLGMPITVITSMPQNDTESLINAWVRRYVTPYVVSSEGGQVQHAKLWLFHWKSKDGADLLQITVSSTNLTPGAFKGQMQAGWTAIVPVTSAKRSDDASRQYAPLEHLLTALGREARCPERTEHFIKLLAGCPHIPGLQFISSIPGQPIDTTAVPFLKASGLRVFVPSLGNWSDGVDGTFADWCTAVGVKPKDIQLIWPDQDHPWGNARDDDDVGNWSIPAPTRSTFVKTGVGLYALPTPASGAFLVDGLEDDVRWSHAKYYESERGLLVGSHNWSLSAWGIPGKVSPRNFELSVFVDGARMPVTRRLPKLDPDAIRTCMPDGADRARPWLLWAQAEWDGVHLTARCQSNINVTCTWFDGTRWRATGAPAAGHCQWRASVSSLNCAPRLVRFGSTNAAASEAVTIAVVDTRPGEVVPVDLLPSTLERADELLFQAYGGRLPGNRTPTKKVRRTTTREPRAKAADASYKPRWLVSTRKLFKVVDMWRNKWKNPTDPIALSDARRLARMLDRIADQDPEAGLGATLAADELRTLTGNVK